MVCYPLPRVPSLLTDDGILIFHLKILQYSSPQGLEQFIFPQVMHKCTIFPLTLEITFYSVLFTCWVKMVYCCYYNLHFSDQPVRMSTMAHSPYIQMRKPRLRAEHGWCPSQFNTRVISVFSTVPRGSTRNQRSLLHP